MSRIVKVPKKRPQPEPKPDDHVKHNFEALLAQNPELQIAALECDDEELTNAATDGDGR